jgi:hypothetical protein
MALLRRRPPPDSEFFRLFAEAGRNSLRATELLDRMIANWPDDDGAGREILACEQHGDRLTHDIIHRLHTTSAPPLDREDIYALASALDDIVDFTEETADFLGLYKIEAPMDQAQQLAGVLVETSRTLSQALASLDRMDGLNPAIVEVHRLENEGDRVSRDAIASLFEAGVDPLFVIRWKDLYERLEDAIDATERVAVVLEAIVIKGR